MLTNRLYCDKHLRYFSRLILGLSCIAWLSSGEMVLAQTVTSLNKIKSISIVQRTPTRWRLTVDCQGPLNYKHFVLQSPLRLVIDLAKTSRFNLANLPPIVRDAPLSAVRMAQKSDHTLRVVFDLKPQVHARVYSMPPSLASRYRVGIELMQSTTELAASTTSHFAMLQQQLAHSVVAAKNEIAWLGRAAYLYSQPG